MIKGLLKSKKKIFRQKKKRGLFKSSTNKTLNADINGAIGIARKVFPEAVQTLRNSKAAFVPIKISINL